MRLRDKVRIILAMLRDNGRVAYRIAKLIGKVHVQTVGDRERLGRILHVGDIITETEANDLSACRSYQVTVTEPRKESKQ
jgi:hypothetical protein